MAYARVAARHFGTEHHEYYVTPDDLVRSIATVAAALRPAIRAIRQRCRRTTARKMAREDGALDPRGDGGDELFGGNSRYARQRLFAAYSWLPRVLRQGFHGAGNCCAARRPSARICARAPAMCDRPLRRCPAAANYNLLLRLASMKSSRRTSFRTWTADCRWSSSGKCGQGPLRRTS
jgi:asparagine synthetase B (glutamine-hydrolysing)